MLHTETRLADLTQGGTHSARVFNDYLLAHVLFALDRSNHLEQLRTCGLPAIPATDRREDAILSSCLSILKDAGLARVDAGTWHLTDVGAEVSRDAGFFVWAIGGYSSLLGALPALLRGEMPPPADPAFVALGASLIDAAHLQHQVDALLDEETAHVVADLGCGGGSRLIRFLLRHQSARGVGVDRRSEAVAIARRDLSGLHLSDRMTAIQGDCLRPLGEVGHIREEVDCVWSFFLLHDLISECAGSFAAVTEAVLGNFPNARRFLFADTTIDERSGSPSGPPIFFRGFQLFHAAMGIRTRTLAEYQQAFSTGLLLLEATFPLNVPNSYLFVFGRR